MRVKYIGSAPITNVYGDWKYGDIKEIERPEGLTNPYFVTLKEVVKHRKIRRSKIRREELQDKMERDSALVLHGD